MLVVTTLSTQPQLRLGEGLAAVHATSPTHVLSSLSSSSSSLSLLSLSSLSLSSVVFNVRVALVCVCVRVCSVWVAVTDKCSQCETLLMCKLLTPPVIQGYFAYPLPQAPHVAAVVHLLIASFESLLIEVPSAQCDSQVWVQCSASEPDVVNHDSDRGPDGHRFLHVALVDPQCPRPPRRVRLAPAKVPQAQVLEASTSRPVHLVSALRRPDTAVLGDIHLL